MAKPRRKQELKSVELTETDDYNARAYTHLMEITQIPRPVMSNKESVANAIQLYLGACQRNGQKLTISGLGQVLGLRRMDIIEIANGHKKCECADLITEAFQMIETFDEQAMKDGKIPPLIAIFNAKNNYGYTDGTKIEIVKEELTNEEIAERYRQMHEIVSEEEEKK